VDIDILINAAELFAATNALRLVNGKADGLSGITVDKYDKHFVIQKFPIASKHTDIKQITDFIAKKYDPDFLILKDRSVKAGSNPAEGFDSKIIISKTDSKTVVTENNIRFSVNVNDTLNTGLFLDMRANRSLIASLAKNKAVLNCFSYTCAFGAYCRKYGASRVVNVDINKKSLLRGEKNYSLNDIAWDSNEFIKSDSAAYMKGALKRENFFDIIILDPPTFSRSGKKIFSVKKDFSQLIELALKILNPKGSLFVSTNCSDVSHALLESFVRKPAAAVNRQPLKITALGQDADFPGTNTVKESYLAALLVDFA
jgi:23S rRNA (cytosine1962-C5)-methyltransferase